MSRPQPPKKTEASEVIAVLLWFAMQLVAAWWLVSLAIGWDWLSWDWFTFSWWAG